MRRAALGLCFTILLVLSVCGSARADRAADGTDVAEGNIIRIRPSGCTVLDVEGKVHSFAAKSLKSMSLDFGAAGRPADVTLEDGKTFLCTLTSKRDDVLVARGTDGRVTELPIGSLKDCVLYPTASTRKVLPIEYVKQKPDFCGEACVEMVTSFMGARLSQEKVNQLAGLTEERGVYSNELERVVRKSGLVTTPDHGSRLRDADDALVDRARLIRSIASNCSVILGVWADPDHKTNERNWNFDHFVLLVGFDLSKHQLLIHDPARRALRAVSFEELYACRKNRSDVAYSITVRPFRAWTLTAEGKTILAELIDIKGETVRLRGSDDESVITLNFRDLSKADGAFLKGLEPAVANPSAAR